MGRNTNALVLPLVEVGRQILSEEPVFIIFYKLIVILILIKNKKHMQKETLTIAK